MRRITDQMDAYTTFKIYKSRTITSKNKLKTYKLNMRVIYLADSYTRRKFTKYETCTKLHRFYILLTYSGCIPLK